MDRKNCSHAPTHQEIILVAWCVRCSGWRVRRVGVDSGSSSDTNSAVVYESHFLPAEEADPMDLLSLGRRALETSRDAELEHLAPKVW